MKRKTTILLADDHAIMRQGLKSILRFQRDFAIVGEAEDGADAVTKVGELHPDVVIMDLIMPNMDGATATKLIRSQHPETKVLILTSFPDSADMANAIENGASGAISKTASKEELFRCLRNIIDGTSAITPDVAKSLDETNDIPQMTDRQKEILQSFTRGLTNGDIAQLLGISTSCVKFHILAIFRKLGAANRTEAVSIAQRKHLLKI